MFEKTQLAVAWGNVTDSTLIAVNPAFARQRGYTVDELVRKPILTLFPQNERDAIELRMSQISKDGHGVFESVHLRKDGTTFPVLLDVSLIEDDNGRPIFQVAYAFDVAELKHTQRKTEEQAKLLDLIFQYSLDCIVLLDKDYNFIRVSNTYARVCNREVSSFPGRNHFDDYPSPLKEEFDEAIRNRTVYRKAGRPFTFPDHPERGTTYWDLGMVPILETDDEHDLLLFTLKDVTQHKLAEEALERSRGRLELQINEMPIGYIVWNHELRVESWNPAAQRIFGFAAEEAVGQDCSIIVPPDLRSHVDDIWRRLMGGDRTAHSVNENVTKDGRRITCQWTNTPLRDTDGRVSGALSMVMDVTERKQAETALRTSEERFRLVAEVTNDVLWDWDLVTDERWWSPNAQEKFGYDPAKERGVEAWSARLHPDDRERVRSRLDETIRTGKTTFVEEYRFLLADGTYGCFMDKGRLVIDASGQPARMIGAMIDVTAAKRAYSTLMEAYARYQVLGREVLAAGEKERRRLSRELHDEFGQVLIALNLYLARIQDGVAALPAQYAGPLSKEVAAANGMLQRLFGSLQEMVCGLRLAVLDELGLVPALHSLAYQIQERHGLRCRIEAMSEDVGRTFGPELEGALYRIAQELLTNVVKHADASDASITLSQADGWAGLTVRDDGRGFEARGGAPTWRFGLRGIQERAELLGGRVEVRSKPGSGTIVTVSIPITAGAERGDLSEPVTPSTPPDPRTRT